MSNYVYDNTALFFPKTNLAPLPGGADSTKYVIDTDWNTLNQAVDDIKGVLRNAAWYGISDQGSDPAPSGISAYLWVNSGTLNLTSGVTNSVLVQSTRTITAGTGLTGGGDLSANRTISLSSVPLGTTISSATAGSLLFAGTSGVLAQNNSNLYWDNTTKHLGIGTNVTTKALTVVETDTASVDDVFEIQNKSASGYSTIWFSNSAGLHKTSFGFANATVAITRLRGKHYLYGTNDFVIDDETAVAFAFKPTSGSVNLEMANGSSGAVSTANTGRIRYTTTGQKFQVSLNGAAYVDLTTGASMAIGNTVTSATAGSVLFATTSSALAQDNANLFWDATNKKLAIGMATFLDNTGIGGATAPTFEVKGQGDISQMASIAYGTSAQASIAGIRGRGTTASPTAVQSGDTLMSFHGVGQYDTTVGHISTASQVIFFAAENWSSGARGGRIGWYTVVNGGTNLLERFGLENDGGIKFQNSSSAAVGASNTGVIRYNTSGQKFQISANGGAYVDLAVGSGMATGGTITGGTAGSILFAGASGVLAQDNANLFWDDTNNYLGLGTAGANSDNTSFGGDTIAQLELSRNSANAAIMVSSFGTGTTAQFYGLHARGTRAVPLAVQADDNLAVFAGAGYGNGTVGRFGGGGSMQIIAEETWTTSSHAARVVFTTVPTTTTSGVERLRISSDGGIQIPASTSAVSPASTGRLRYNSTAQKFQLSSNASAYSDIVTRDYVSVERKIADGSADPTVDTTYIAGAGTDLTLAAGTVDGFVKNFVVTSGSGTVTPAALANADVMTWAAAPANFSLVWDATGATWHIIGTPYNVVPS